MTVNNEVNLEQFLSVGKTTARERRVPLGTTIDTTDMQCIREIAQFYGSNPAVVARNAAGIVASWWRANKETIMAAAAEQAAQQATITQLAMQPVGEAVPMTQEQEGTTTTTNEPAGDWEIVEQVTSDIYPDQEEPTSEGVEEAEATFPTNSWTASFTKPSPTPKETLREAFV